MNLIDMFDSYAREKGFGPRIVHFENLGFATYHLHDGECYIEDIYVMPCKRKKGAGSSMADKIVEIAKGAGINILTGSVSKDASGQEISRAALIGYGF